VASGAPGGNASLGVSGAGGSNESMASQISLSAPNVCYEYVYAQGQNGKSLAPIPNFTTCPFTQQPAPTCPLADYNTFSFTLFPLIRGGYSAYIGGQISATPAGTGGVVISFFT
jgi:hypothetical protein